MILRALIVMLLVLNAGAAAWAMWGNDGRAAADAGAPDAAVPALQLAVARAAPPLAMPAPRAAAPVPAAPAPTAPAALPDGPARCLRLGPFADAAALAAARATVQASAARSTSFERMRAGRGWRVLLPPLADRPAARAMVERIRAAGIEDYYIVADGPEANSIALGRYGSEQAAHNRRAALQAAGFPAIAEPLGQAGAQHWLDVHLAPDANAAAFAGARRIDCSAFGNPGRAG